jgi:hypothetical protein
MRGFLLMGFLLARTVGMRVLVAHWEVTPTKDGPAAKPVLLKWLYGPATQTLAEGFDAYSRRSALNVTFTTVGSFERMGPTMAPLSRGDMLVWIGVHKWRQVPWKSLRARGVFTVWYIGEPHEDCRYVGEDGMDETWEYTRAHGDERILLCARKRRKGPSACVSRYMPPGYVARNIPPSPFRDGEPPKLVFFGHAGVHAGASPSDNRRADSLARIKAEMGDNATLEVVSNVWTEADFARHMAGNALFLSLHKSNGTPNAFESFRAAQVLRYGGILISERSYSADEDEFEGLVLFKRVDAIGTAYRELAFNTPAAQLANRAAAAAARYSTLFRPVKLFERAGVYALLDRLFNVTQRDAHKTGEAERRGLIQGPRI